MDATPIKKPWGTCFPLHEDDASQVDRLLINAGGKSSVHYHHYKANLFFVVSGVIAVTLHPGLKHAERRVLGVGQSLMVYARTVHQFEAIEDCELIEAYVSLFDGYAVRRDDIERFAEKVVS